MAIGFGYKNNAAYAFGAGQQLYNAAVSRATATGYRNGRSYTQTGYKRRRPVGNRLSLKRQMIKLHSAKHSTQDLSANNTHNTILTSCPTQNVVQGDGNTNRDGDAIHIECLKLKGSLVSSTTAGAYQHRIIVGWSGEEVTTALIATNLVSGLAATELFLPTTSGTWVANGIINPKAFTVLYDQTFDINSQVAAAQDIVNFAVSIPIHQDFDYQSSSSVQGKNRNLFVIAIAEVAGGTSGVTAAGQHIISTDLVFKNI